MIMIIIRTITMIIIMMMKNINIIKGKLRSSPPTPSESLLLSQPLSTVSTPP